MSSRPSFGDFAREATRQLEPEAAWFQPVAGRSARDAVAQQVQEFSGSLDRLLAVMERYADDVSATFGGITGDHPRWLSPWARATVEARGALASARGHLRRARDGTGPVSRQQTTSPAAHGPDAAATTLATGRDLMHSHIGLRPDGTRLGRTEWAPVVMSATVARTLLAELAGWARQVAPQGSRLALARAPSRPWLAEDQRNLNAACQWLWRPGAAVEWAHRQDPVLADDVRLLHAIPSGALEPRRLPPDPKRSLNCARERPAAPSESAEPRKAPAPTQPGPRSSAQSHSASPRPAPPSSAITARSCCTPWQPAPPITARHASAGR